jgi:DNA-binding winged helix-turn-helix (wHTH) protein/tetratricopeptide (TPR) repeat protein
MALGQLPQLGLVLDLSSFRLLRDGQPVKLEKGPMELLALLARRRGVLVTRDEIAGAIWPDGTHVDVDAGINTAIRKIRIVLDDDSASPRFVETVIGMGYRFAGPITVIESAPALPAPPGPAAKSAYTPSLVLLAAGLVAAVTLGFFASHRRQSVSADPSPEAAATEAYLLGRFEMAPSVVPVPDAARFHFERAIALDPWYAPAYAGLADYCRSRAVGDDEGSERSWQLADQYAMQALSLNSDSAETQIAVAEIKLMHDWDWPEAHEHARRALQLNPRLPEAHAVYARYLRIAGDVDAAVDQRRQAVALDPFRADLTAQLTMEYFFDRNFESATASARQLLEFESYQLFAHGMLCDTLARLGRFDDSVNECTKWLELSGHADWIPAYAREYHAHGYEAANLLIARNLLNKILKRPNPDLWDLANAYVLAGCRDEALRTLFQGLKTHEPGLLQLRVDPDFDSIRQDPRYAELVRRIGFPAN